MNKNTPPPPYEPPPYAPPSYSQTVGGVPPASPFTSADICEFEYNHLIPYYIFFNINTS